MDFEVVQQHLEAYHRHLCDVDLNADDYDVLNREVQEVRAMNYMFDLDSIYHHLIAMTT
jgi:hypothetical protein